MVSRTEHWVIVRDPRTALEETASQDDTSIADTDEEGKEKLIFAPECAEEELPKTIIRPRNRAPGKSVLELLLLGGEKRCFDVESLGSRSEVISEIDVGYDEPCIMEKPADMSWEAYILRQIQLTAPEHRTHQTQQKRPEVLQTCVKQIKAVNAETRSSSMVLVGGCLLHVSVIVMFCWILCHKNLGDARRLLLRALRSASPPRLPPDLSFCFVLDSVDLTPTMMHYAPL